MFILHYSHLFSLTFSHAHTEQYWRLMSLIVFYAFHRLQPSCTRAHSNISGAHLSNAQNWLTAFSPNRHIWTLKKFPEAWMMAIGGAVERCHCNSIPQWCVLIPYLLIELQRRFKPSNFTLTFSTDPLMDMPTDCSIQYKHNSHTHTVHIHLESENNLLVMETNVSVIWLWSY